MLDLCELGDNSKTSVEQDSDSENETSGQPENTRWIQPTQGYSIFLKCLFVCLFLH